MAIADTNFLIDVLAGDGAAMALLDRLIEIGEPIWTPAIALHELYYGARLHADPKRETARVRELEQALPPVAFTGEAARVAGRIEAMGEQEGVRPGRADTQIAAIALSRGEPVVTAEEWFDTVDGLPVKRY